MRPLRALGTVIDAFRPADGPPPQTLGAFIRWSLSGAWPPLMLAAVIGALAGTMEVISALLLGWTIDAALASGPERVLADHAPLLIGSVAFFLILRPLAFGIFSASNSVLVGPNVLPLVLSRLHRWTMGQDVTFFDNDVAGRIAQ